MFAQKGSTFKKKKTVGAKIATQEFHFWVSRKHPKPPAQKEK